MFKSIIIKYIKDFLDILMLLNVIKKKTLFVLLIEKKILLNDFLL